MIYLWLISDLRDPRALPTPLATYRISEGLDGLPYPHAFQWAPGEGPRFGYTYRRQATLELLQAVPNLIEQGVRFNATGLGSGNIQEGRPFTLESLLPGIRRALNGRRAWTWDAHGAGYALYAGRGLNSHGLNVLSADQADAFDTCGEDTRDVIATLLNLVAP